MHIQIRELMSVFTVYIFYSHEVSSLSDLAREMRVSSAWPCSGRPRANQYDFNKQNLQNWRNKQTVLVELEKSPHFGESWLPSVLILDLMSVWLYPTGRHSYNLGQNKKKIPLALMASESIANSAFL